MSLPHARAAELHPYPARSPRYVLLAFWDVELGLEHGEREERDQVGIDFLRLSSLHPHDITTARPLGRLAAHESSSRVRLPHL